MNPQITDDLFIKIATLSNLRSLQISFCPKITAKGLEHLNALDMRRLKVFILNTKQPIGGLQVFKKMAKAPKLDTVNFSPEFRTSARSSFVFCRGSEGSASDS